METSEEMQTAEHEQQLKTQKATGENASVLDSIKIANARLLAENARIRKQLALSKKRVNELEAQIGKNLDDKSINCFERRVNKEKLKDQADTISKLKKMLALKTRQMLDAVLELKGLKESFKRWDKKNRIAALGKMKATKAAQLMERESTETQPAEYEDWPEFRHEYEDDDPELDLWYCKCKRMFVGIKGLQTHIDNHNREENQRYNCTCGCSS